MLKGYQNFPGDSPYPFFQFLKDDMAAMMMMTRKRKNKRYSIAINLYVDA